MNKTKTCRKCGPEKGPINISEFGKLSTSPDGLNHTCKSCINAAQREAYIKKKEKEKEELNISPKEAQVIQNYLNHLDETTATVDIVKEKKEIDEALLKAVRPFYYYLLSLRTNEEGFLIMDTPPHAFCQTFFPNAPYAGLQLFNTFIERDEVSYKFKRKVELNDLAKEFKTLIAISSLVPKPSNHVMAEDIAIIREMVMQVKASLDKYLS